MRFLTILLALIAVSLATSLFVDMNQFIDDYEQNPDTLTPEVIQKYFGYACGWGDKKLTRRLLKDPRVDPAHDNSNAFELAFANNQPYMVEMLIRDGRCELDLLFNPEIEFSWLEQTRIKWLVRGISKALFDACVTDNVDDVHEAEVLKLFEFQVDMLIERARSSPKVRRVLRLAQLKFSRFAKELADLPKDPFITLLQSYPDWTVAEMDELLSRYLATRRFARGHLPDELNLKITNLYLPEPNWRYSLMPHAILAGFLAIGRYLLHIIDDISPLNMVAWMFLFLMYFLGSHIASVKMSRIPGALLIMDAMALGLSQAGSKLFFEDPENKALSIFGVFYPTSIVFALWVRLYETTS